MDKQKQKRKYLRKCGCCGDRHEQSEMVRTDKSPNGWFCKWCYSAEIDLLVDMEEW